MPFIVLTSSFNSSLHTTLWIFLEQAIHTFNAHFKAVFASLDHNFPLNKQDRVIKHSKINLNLIRASTTNLRASTYAYLSGEFDYNTTPLVSPDTRILVQTNHLSTLCWGLMARNNGQQAHHWNSIDISRATALLHDQ